MELPNNTKIAGKFSVADWKSRRVCLNDFENTMLWEQTYNDFFIERIKSRYLNPIELIKKHDKENGEGFAIMTIICSLIEFLESTYLGLNYNEEKQENEYEYGNGKSSTLFNDFLTKRIPEYLCITELLAKQFFKKVRCGLLHEARTCGKWVIMKENAYGLIIEETESKIIVYRNNFYNVLIEYIYCQYKTELLASDELKRAFLRKFDKLCEEF